MKPARQKRCRVTHLIVGGATRSGTTSLFKYLSAHPQTCVASLKETRFFLDKDYPLPRLFHYDEGIDKYAEFFANCSEGQVLVDATPDYLFCPSAAERIVSTLQSVRIIFVLRDPVERLISWYRYAKQNRMITSQITFEEYVAAQIAPQNLDGIVPQHLRALEQGRFLRYLQKYYEIFDPEDILLVSTESLRESPGEVMRDICAFAGISHEFFRDFEYEVINRSINVRSTALQELQLKSARILLMFIHKRIRTRRILSKVWSLVKPIFMRANTTTDEAIYITPKTRAYLASYYLSERRWMSKFVGRPTLLASQPKRLTSVSNHD